MFVVRLLVPIYILLQGKPCASEFQTLSLNELGLFLSLCLPSVIRISANPPDVEMAICRNVDPGT